VRVFLDTNVLISAFATRGLSADLLRLVLTEHELITSEVVLEEVERVLTRKLALRAGEVAEIVSFLREYPTQPRPSEPASVPISDPDDPWVLACAIAAGADVLVTGDTALLECSSLVTELQITNPRGFWESQRGLQP
jgi:putative PIN family toxin of toxin-antitoxin system